MRASFFRLVIFLILSTSFTQAEQSMLGQPAPSFRLKGLDGKTLALDDLQGRFVVIHFAASW